MKVEYPQPGFFPDIYLVCLICVAFLSAGNSAFFFEISFLSLFKDLQGLFLSYRDSSIHVQPHPLALYGVTGTYTNHLDLSCAFHF